MKSILKPKIKECENFLGPHKFGGVHIAPPNEHTRVLVDDLNDPNTSDYSGGRPWYEIYQPASFKLHSRTGPSFKDYPVMFLMMTLKKEWELKPSLLIWSKDVMMPE